jgi:hypothetical protein
MQLIETIENMSARDIGLRSLTEAIDTTTSGGRLIFHIFGALAEFERGVIRAPPGRARRRPGAGQGMRSAACALGQGSRCPGDAARSEITVEQVAKRLGVVPSTLYRHLPGGRGGLD